MTPTTLPLPHAGPLDRARAATRTRLLNTYLREVAHDVSPVAGVLRIPLAQPGRPLVAELVRRSPSGHHVWGPEVGWEDGGARRAASHEEVVAALVAAVDAASPDSPEQVESEAAHSERCAELVAQIDNSVRRTAYYLGAPARGRPVDARDRTRHAEQSVLQGHPFHPTPKSLQGAGVTALADDELDRYLPEMGGSFRLHHLAIAPHLAVGATTGPGPWTPPDVQARAPQGWPVVPVHPLQVRWLGSRERVARALGEGLLVDLGPGGGDVYPTSSVRTVCDPHFPTMWKLPLHVQITNFVRTIPSEHAVRSSDASRVVGGLRDGWAHPGFATLVETGWRGVDPEEVGEEAAADLNVVYRENPFTTGDDAPRVLAGIVEEGVDGSEPPLVTDARAVGDPERWLRAFLRISLLPMLAIFARDGVGFEAHLQNSLVHTEGGLPVRFWVRDMEGTHVSRDRLPAGLAGDSPLVYDEQEAWRRLRYHAVVNQLASVVAVLGHHLDFHDEEDLWRVVAETLGDLPAGCAAAAPYAEDLRTSPTLPAKANLLSRFGARSEHALFVDLPNPIARALA